MADARVEIAWLLWCLNQGYTKPEDRAIMTNWLGDEVVHPDDAETQRHLLEMADIVLGEARKPPHDWTTHVHRHEHPQYGVTHEHDHPHPPAQEREYSVQLSWLQVTKLRAWLGEPRFNTADNWSVLPNGSLPLGRVNFEAVMGGGILVRTQPFRSQDDR